MDKNLKWINEQRILRTIEALKGNNINGYLVKTKEDIIKQICQLVDEGNTVACGGSMSLFECGVIEHLRSGRYNFIDRYRDGLSKEELKNIYRESFFADAYFASSNAITENGKLYNVDGNGNRVAAMLYGPDKVIIIAGINKIVKNIEEAVNRNRQISGPANAKRLNKLTPCARVGYCMDCRGNDKICREFTVISSQANKDRIHVIFINEELGY